MTQAKHAVEKEAWAMKQEKEKAGVQNIHRIVSMQNPTTKPWQKHVVRIRMLPSSTRTCIRSGRISIPYKTTTFKYLNVFTFFNMVSVTLSLPPEVKQKMDQFPEMNWSGFIRKCVTEKTNELAWKEEILEKLKKEEELTVFAVDLQRKARKGRAQQLKKKGLI